jgi:hypothetical protein
MNETTIDHAFSIELSSKKYVSFEQAKDVESSVLIEGYLGDLISLTFVEGMMMELKGTTGIFRLDISETEFDELKNKEVDA